MQLQGIKYTDILKELKLSGLPNKQVIDNPTDKSWIIRHDVDNHILKSVHMAELEHKHKVVSTYYMLNYDTGIPTDKNYFYNAEYEYRCISAFGHDIGWHNNAISELLMNYKDDSLRDIIHRPIDYLRSLGFKIESSASHGDRLCHKMGYVNYEIWNEFTKKNTLKHDRFDLSEFGLKEESYNIQYTHYLSESGGVWKHNPINYIKDWIKNGKGNLQILIHPQWW